MKTLKIFFLLCVLAALAATAQAQTITKTFGWDASASVGTSENPIKYRLYRCIDQTYVNCVVTEAGTALQADMTLQNGTCWVFVTAYWNALTVDGVPLGDIAESGKSNILKIQVQIPPGNPANAKIKVTQMAASTSGQTLK